MYRFDYLILTPTYNRASMLVDLISQVQEESERTRHKVCHIIIDDGSDDSQNYPDRMLECKRPRYVIKYIRLRKNHGRDGFWQIYTSLFERAREVRFDYAIGLADDMVLCRDFLRRSERYFRWCQDQDQRVCCVNLFSRFPTNWGTARYVDGIYFCDRTFFEALQWRIRPISPERFEGSKKRSHRSSGVHQQITRRLSGSRSIAPVSGISYVRPRRAESVMFPASRFPDRPPSAPWECNFIDD